MKKITLAAVLIFAAFVVSSTAQAEALFFAEAGGIKITLHDEKCALPAVSNLGKRATWEEGGKSFDGCYGGHPQYPLVIFYFSDKTVVIIPVEMFRRLTNT